MCHYSIYTLPVSRRVNVTFITKEGNKVAVRGKIGDNLLYLAHRYEIPMEGACEASLGIFFNMRIKNILSVFF